MKKSLFWGVIVKGMGLLFIIFQFISSIFEMKMFQSMVDEAVDERLGNQQPDQEESEEA